MKKQKYFEPTVEGYTQAREFLIKHGGKWLTDNTLSADGYTIVYMANELIQDIESYQSSEEVNE